MAASQNPLCSFHVKVTLSQMHLNGIAAYMVCRFHPVGDSFFFYFSLQCFAIIKYNIMYLIGTPLV